MLGHHLKMKINLIWLLIILFSVGYIEQAQADPFLNYPGGRAKAMAGTFTAVADDNSAVWFNPAGIAGCVTSDTVEGGQVISVTDEAGKLDTGDSSFLIGGKFSADAYGVGLFYYSPYTIK